MSEYRVVHRNRSTETIIYGRPNPDVNVYPLIFQIEFNREEGDVPAAHREYINGEHYTISGYTKNNLPDEFESMHKAQKIMRDTFLSLDKWDLVPTDITWFDKHQLYEVDKNKEYEIRRIFPFPNLLDKALKNGKMYVTYAYSSFPNFIVYNDDKVVIVFQPNTSIWNNIRIV